MGVTQRNTPSSIPDAPGTGRGEPRWEPLLGSDRPFLCHLVWDQQLLLPLDHSSVGRVPYVMYSLAFTLQISPEHLLTTVHTVWGSVATLVAQMVKNLPAMQESQVQPLGQEDPLEKEIGTHSSVLTRESWWATVGGVTKSQTRLSD